MDLTVHGKHVFAATGGRSFDPALPAVVFLHGSGMDHTVWQMQTRWFAWHGRSVLALDLPGHGRSTGAALDTVAALAQWTLDAVAAAGSAQAALVGHSLGALVALEAAASAPGKVRALALCGVAADMSVQPDLLMAGLAGDALAYRLIASWGVGPRAQIGRSEAPGGWILGGTLRLLERGYRGVVGIDLAACDRYKTALVAAAKVACPAMFVLGAADRMTTPRAAASLIAAIAGARAETIRHAGHMMMTEQPGATLDALKSLL